MKSKQNHSARGLASEKQVAKSPARGTSPLFQAPESDFMDVDLEQASTMGNQAMLDAISARSNRPPPPPNPDDGGGRDSPMARSRPEPPRAHSQATGLQFGGVQIIDDDEDFFDLEGAAQIGEGPTTTGLDPQGLAPGAPPTDGIGGGGGDGTSTAADGTTPGGWGAALAEHRGVTAFGNGPDPGFAPSWAYQEYGYLYQCVELVNRFAAQVLGAGNLKGSGNANNYSNLNISGLTWMDNVGGPSLPGDGDILVFHGGSVGHVGIATSGSPSGIGLIQQNWGTLGSASLSVDGSDGHYTVGGLSGYSLAGWHSSNQSPDLLPDLSWNRQAFIFVLAPALGLNSESPEAAWQDAVDRGIIEQADPSGAITRSAAAKILAVGLGLDASVAYDANAVVPFADTKPSDWWYPWAGTCRAFGIFPGGSDNCFRGADTLSESEADILAQRAGGGVALRTTEDQMAHLSVDPYSSQDVSSSTTGVTESESPSGDTEQEQAELGAAVHNLGEVEGLGDDFFAVAGGIVDMLVPNVGDRRKLELGFLVPVGGGAVKVGLAFEGEIKRKDDSVEVDCELGVQVVAGFSTFIGKAYVSADVGGYMEASGDHGAECFRLMILAIHQRIASVSDRAADALLEPSSVDSIIAEMDSNDQVSSGLDIDLGAGVEAPEGAVPNVDLSASGELRLGTMLTADGGQLTAHDVEEQSYGVTIGTPLMDVKGKLKTEMEDDVWKSVEVKVTGEKDFSWEELTVLIGASHTISGLIGDLVGVVRGTSGLVDDGNTARQVGAVADFIADNSGLGLGTAWGTQKALENIPSFEGVKVGHKFSVIAESDKDNGFSFELRLDRTSSFEFGDEQSTGVHLEIESAEEVFSFERTKAPGSDEWS